AAPAPLLVELAALAGGRAEQGERGAGAGGERRAGGGDQGVADEAGLVHDQVVQRVAADGEVRPVAREGDDAAAVRHLELGEGDTGELDARREQDAPAPPVDDARLAEGRAEHADAAG